MCESLRRRRKALSKRCSVPGLRVAVVALTLASATTGCVSSWYARPLSILRGPLGPRDRVQLWVGAHTYVMHGLTLSGDSLRAVPYLQSPTCDSCAMTLAVRDVDSVRVQAVDSEKARLAAALVAVGFIATVVGLWAKGMKGY
jgi:hypothetical protein